MRPTTDSIVDRSRPPTARLVVALGLGVTAASAAVTFGGIAVLVDPAGSNLDVLLLTLAVLTMAAVGTVLAIRVPGNAIGWLLLVSAFLLGLEFLALMYAVASDRYAAGSWSGTLVAAWLYGNLLAAPVLIMAIGIPLIYPDGRLLSPRWRWLVALLVLIGAIEILKWFRVGLIPDTEFQNPFGIAGIEPLLDLFALPPFQLAGALVLLSPIASVGIRYRRGTSMERAQMKWLIATSVMTVAAWFVVGISGAVGATTIMTLAWYAGLLAFSALPMAIGFAVLRYRLYEIDRIISRTIAWAVVTGVLVAVFAVGLIALQAALVGVTQGETLSVAASTLVVATLFLPLRRGVQHAIDRRFDRATLDAQRTVELFAERLGNEVALEAVVADIEATAAASVRPATLGIWLRGARS